MEIVSVSVVCKVLSLIDQLSCPQIWNIELKDSEAQREKKNKGDIFLLEEQHENFVAAVTK